MRSISIAFVIILAFVLGVFANEMTRGAEEIICDPTNVVELHNIERIYPAWRYECATGISVVILD